MSHVHRVRSTIGASATLAMLLASPAFADDWGTLKGRFKFGGAVPTAAALKADKQEKGHGGLRWGARIMGRADCNWVGEG